MRANRLNGPNRSTVQLEILCKYVVYHSPQKNKEILYSGVAQQ